MNIKHEIGKFYHKLRGDDISILVKKGLRLGTNVFIGSDVLIDVSFPWLISIGDDCTLTSNIIILAHDASTFKHIGYTKIGRVSLGKRTFVGAGSIILPGVIIGENVIIGAGSVVTKDIPDNSVAVGNPASVIGSTSDYINRHKKNLETKPVFNHGWTLETGITEENKKIMNDTLKDGIGYDI
jgi:maltose O-acetyltransferase